MGGSNEDRIRTTAEDANVEVGKPTDWEETHGLLLGILHETQQKWGPCLFQSTTRSQGILPNPGPRLRPDLCTNNAARLPMKLNHNSCHTRPRHECVGCEKCIPPWGLGGDHLHETTRGFQWWHVLSLPISSLTIRSKTVRTSVEQDIGHTPEDPWIPPT